MFVELGGFFGWMIVVSFGATLLNYVVKILNKKYGKQINANPIGKKVMNILMIVFVRNHRFFGLAAAMFMCCHFTLQFLRYGLNYTGLITASLILIQVSLGAYAKVTKRQRKGAWFIVHRTIAVLILLAITVHLLVPGLLN